jgi:benzoate/toluate 1,2-dioxygenase reductase subunit
MEFETQLTACRRLSSTIFELQLERPDGFAFRPGQHVTVHHRLGDRDYSLACAPDDPRLVLCIREFSDRGVSAALGRADIGTVIRMSGPHGYFVPRSGPHPAIWVATGTGVAPFRAMARSGGKCRLCLHGVADQAEALYADDLRPAAEHYRLCVSRSTAPADDDFRGRVTDYLAQRCPPGRYDFYLCGRQEMVRDVTLLVDTRFPGSRVFSEVFY